MSFTRAVFEERPNRFVVRARTEAGQITAHLPATGRLREILVPGAPLILHPKRGPDRRHAFDVWAAWHGGEWVALDARAANSAVRQTWTELKGVPRSPLIGEVPVGGCRLDFGFGEGNGFLEVKAVTLVEGDRALFPDAPTDRGRRHVELLGELAESGRRAVLVFAGMRRGFSHLAVHASHDPAFADAVGRAVERGMEVRVLAFRVTPEGLSFDGERPFGG